MFNWLNPFNWFTNKSEGNNNCSSKSKESLFVQSTQKNPQQFSEVDVKSVLSDFEKLDFEKSPCNDTLDEINYNGGKEANPFDKIAKYYGRKKNVFLFISMLRNGEQLKKITDIIDKKCDDIQDREEFRKRKEIYLDRISKGEQDAKELLNDDCPGAFFNGPHTGENINIHQNLNIKIQPGQTLEVSSLFNKKRELERGKVYNEKGERILTIKKNEEQQRNYCFEKDAICGLQISWSAENEGEFVDCFIILNVNSDKIEWKATIDGKAAELGEILKLAEQNEDVLIEDEALHEFLLEKNLKQDPQSQEEIVTLEATPLSLS